MACHRYICTYISHVFGFLKSSTKTTKQPTMQPKNKSMQHRIHFSLLLLSYSWGRRGLNEFVLGLNLKWKLLTILNRNNFSRFGIMSSLILVNPSELSPPSSLSWFSCKYKLDLIECSSSSSSFFSFLPKNSTLFSSQKAKPTIGRQVPNDCSGQYYYNLATNLIYDPNITCKFSRLRAEYTCVGVSALKNKNSCL